MSSVNCFSVHMQYTERTALMMAVQCQKLDALKCLMEAGAAHDLQDKVVEDLCI